MSVDEVAISFNFMQAPVEKKQTKVGIVLNRHHLTTIENEKMKSTEWVGWPIRSIEFLWRSSSPARVASAFKINPNKTYFYYLDLWPFMVDLGLLCGSRAPTKVE